MKGLGCLIQNTNIRKDIGRILEVLAAENIMNDRGFSIQEAYGILTKKGIEIDKESTAVIYEETFDTSDGNFSSQEALNEFALRDFKETLDNLSKIGQGSEDVKKIGSQSPGKAAARQIVNMFRNAFVTDEKTQSLMRKLQDVMYKAAQRAVDKSVLPEKQEKAKKPFDEILFDAFRLQDERGVPNLMGTLNGAREVFTEFKKEVKKYIDELEQSGASEEVIEKFKDYSNALLDKTYDILLSSREAQDVIKGALIEAGFAKDVTRKGEKVRVFDWEKLTNGIGNPSYIKDNITAVLKSKGFSDEQIRRINSSLENEYNNLTADIISKAQAKIVDQNQRVKESAQNELDRRNKIIAYEQSIDAKRLARLYNLGLFEFAPKQYDILLNKMLGMNDIDQKTWIELKQFGRALSNLYAAKIVNAAGEQTDIPEQYMKAAINSINEKIGSILRQNQNRNSTLLKVARAIDGWISAGMRMVLANAGNMIFDNPVSGFFASKTADLRLLASGDLGGKDFRTQRKKFSKSVYKDMVEGRGEHYGDVSSTFYVRNGLDHLKNRVDDMVTGGEGSGSRGVQTVLSFFTGKMLLDGLDSRFKANLTNKYLIHNLVKILIDKNNPNGFKTKAEALSFISENLLGEGIEKARTKAREIIRKVNAEAGQKILPDSDAFIERFANDIVLANLSGYQPGLGREVITTEQVLAAYNSSYKTAGRDLGHVANNPLSMGLNALSGGLTRMVDAAVKEGNYPKASAYVFMQMLNKNLFNPFVGGASNWVVLTLERMGGGLITGGFNTAINKGKPLQFGDDASMRRFEESLYDDNLRQAQLARGVVGGMAALLVYAAAMAAINAEFGDDDEAARRAYASWREKNLYISKFIDRFTPELLMAMMAVETGQTSRYLQQKWSLGNSQYTPQAKAAMAIKYAASGKSPEAAGKAGELVGGFINAPLPWRLTRDVVTLVDGLRGKYVKPGYAQSQGFAEGFFKNGFFEWAGIVEPAKAEPMSSGGRRRKNKERL